MAGEMVFAQVLPQVALGISGVVAQLPGALAEFVNERSVCWEAGAKANPTPTHPFAREWGEGQARPAWKDSRKVAKVPRSMAERMSAISFS